MFDSILLRVIVPAVASTILAWLAWLAAFQALPMDDRRWHDRAPRLWRWSWPLIRVIAHGLRPWLPGRIRVVTMQKLRQADLDRALDAEQWLAGCIVAALSGVGILAFLSFLWGRWAGPHLQGSRPISSGAMLFAMGMASILAVLVLLLWRRDRASARLKAIHRALPFYLDVITLAIESGANLSGALTHALSKGPPGPLHREIQRMVRDVRAGQSRIHALRALSDRVDLPSVRSWMGALIAAEKHGSSLGVVLRAQSEQRREERFQAAEKMAMRAPVKMLFPLLLFIFPCTLALLFFPVVVRLLEEGLLR